MVLKARWYCTANMGSCNSMRYGMNRDEDPAGVTNNLDGVILPNAQAITAFLQITVL